MDTKKVVIKGHACPYVIVNADDVPEGAKVLTDAEAAKLDDKAAKLDDKTAKTVKPIDSK